MMCDVAVSCLPWNRERAHELCSEAWTLALAIQGESRESTFARVAVAFARAEDYKEAHKIIAQIQSAGTRAQAQADLAVRLARAGDLEKARETAVQIPAGYERARAICSVAAGFVRAKRREAGEMVGQAERMANEIPDKELRSSVLAELASNLSDLGLLVRAAPLIEAIQTADTRNRALSGLADAHARDGAVREALMMVAMRSVDTRAGAARPLDEFVGVISRWVDGLERAKRGLPLAALAEAVQVAAWIRPDWARIYRIVSGTAEKRD
jgi:hypothetical protein